MRPSPNPVFGLEHKLNKQTGGPGMFARVVVDVEPTGSVDVGELEFVNATSGGVVPAEFARAVADGCRDAMSQGPRGFPLVGVKVVTQSKGTRRLALVPGTGRSRPLGSWVADEACYWHSTMSSRFGRAPGCAAAVQYVRLA